MSEQDELTKKTAEQDGQQVDETVVGEQVNSIEMAGEDIESSGRVLDASSENMTGKDDADIAGGGIADGEVRVVDPPPNVSSSGRLLLLVVLVVVLLGGGLFLLKTGLLTGQATTEVATVEVEPQAPIKLPIERPVEEIVLAQKATAVSEKDNAPKTPDVTVAEKGKPALSEAAKKSEPGALYSVLVGPYLNSSELDAAAAELRKLGFSAEHTEGSGMVTMVRLFEGLYPADQARERLAVLKETVKSAFLLPAGEKRALYAGSFSDPERASRLSDLLAKKGIKVKQVGSEIEMSGKMLLAALADLETAQQIAAQISKSGFKTQVVRK